MNIDELRKLFGEMREILEAEGERNWIRGISVICNTLAEANPISESEQIERAKQTFNSMNGGAGSFADYYIHRDEFDERMKANERLDQIRDRLWELLSVC